MQIIASVTSLANGSMNSVSGCGTSSMSDSLIGIHPRMLDPSNPMPSSNTSSSSDLGRDGEVLPQAGEVHEPQVDGLDLAFAEEGQDFAGRAGGFAGGHDG